MCCVVLALSFCCLCLGEDYASLSRRTRCGHVISGNPPSSWRRTVYPCPIDVRLGLAMRFTLAGKSEYEELCHYCIDALRDIVGSAVSISLCYWVLEQRRRGQGLQLTRHACVACVRNKPLLRQMLRFFGLYVVVTSLSLNKLMQQGIMWSTWWTFYENYLRELTKKCIVHL